MEQIANEYIILSPKYIPKMKYILNHCKNAKNYIMVSPFQELTSAAYNLQYINYEVQDDYFYFYNKTLVDNCYNSFNLNNIKFMEVKTGIIGVMINTHNDYQRLQFKINDVIEYPPLIEDLTGNFLYLPGKNHPVVLYRNNFYCSNMRYYESWILDYRLFVIVDRNVELNEMLYKIITDKYIINCLTNIHYEIDDNIDNILNQINIKNYELIEFLKKEKNTNIIYEFIDNINKRIYSKNIDNRIYLYGKKMKKINKNKKH